VGGAAQIGHFGGGLEPCRVTGVHEQGRRLVVTSASGEQVEFVLNRATARFVSVDSARRARLHLLDG
jgi:hypothetical protein